MATIGVFDYDFMNYENVIPNLECAKIYTYYHNHREIATLAPTLEPAMYTKFFVRKEYDDGCYPPQLFAPNCIYGGRAFNPIKYSPLDDLIERTIPNMRLYEKYASKFGNTGRERQLIKRILNCAHVRLSTDEKEPKSIEQLCRILDTGRYTGIVFHDYDLARVDKSYDIIYELSRTRRFVNKEGINPYAIGNKFPIQVFSPEELEKWLKIICIPEIFSLQYNGIIPHELLYELCTENRRMARQIWYKIDESWYGENHFLEYDLPKIFVQVLFLRRQNIKILLKYDEQKITTPELKNLLDLLNCWLHFSWTDKSIPRTQTLYHLCKHNAKLHYRSWAMMFIQIATEDIRNSFQFIRERNYELFKMFYEWDQVVFKGGEFYNEWTGDKSAY